MESYTLVNNVTFWISKTHLRGDEHDANAYEVRIGNDTITTKKSNALIEENALCDGFHDCKFAHFVPLLAKESMKQYNFQAIF